MHLFHSSALWTAKEWLSWGWTWWSWRSFSTRAILWFYDEVPVLLLPWEAWKIAYRLFYNLFTLQEKWWNHFSNFSFISRKATCEMQLLLDCMLKYWIKIEEKFGCRFLTLQTLSKDGYHKCTFSCTFWEQ